jgi:glycosyltransferase involved in cell wall biosynthesis
MALMKACDVFVLNSSYEGLPHTVAEAMTLGLAIVTTGAGGTMEVVRHGETALVAAPNHDCLTTTLSKVLMDSDLRCKLGNRARVVANEIFSQKRTVDRTEELLSACI